MSSEGKGLVNMRSAKAVLFSLLLLLALACGSEAPASPSTPLPAAVPPTLTPAPTATPAAPATPLPAPTAALSISSGPRTQASPTPAAVATPTRAPAPSPTPVLFPYTVTDSNGNQVTFDAPPERIVAYDSAAVEVLFAIGQGHRVVGTHSFVSYPPEVASIPKVGDAFNIDIEAVVALKPDLVYVFYDRFLPDLERAGLKVLYVRTVSDDFRKVADHIRMWGRITGSPAQAEAVAADFEARIRQIEDIMAPYAAGPSIFQDVGGLWTPGPDTLVGQVFSLLKLQNIAHDVSGYVQLSPEVVVQRDPQVIIAADRQAILDNPAFSNLLAVRNNAVYELPSNALDVAGPRFVEGIEELARLVYPALFR